MLPPQSSTQDEEGFRVRGGGGGRKCEGLPGLALLLKAGLGSWTLWNKPLRDYISFPTGPSTQSFEHLFLGHRKL